MDLSRALLHNYLHHNTEYKRGTTGQKQAESIVFGLAGESIDWDRRGVR